MNSNESQRQLSLQVISHEPNTHMHAYVHEHGMTQSEFLLFLTLHLSGMLNNAI